MPWLSSRSSWSASRKAHARLLEDPAGGIGIRSELRLGESERHGDGDKALLSGVVQIALDAPPLGVGRLDDARPGGSELVEAGAQVRLEPLVLEREPRSGTDCADELGLLPERRIMDERGDAAALPLDDRRNPGVAVGRQLDRPAAEVDVASLLGQPVGDRERRIVQRPRQGLAQPAGRTRLPQLDDEVGDRSARQAAAQEADLERERHDRVGDEEREIDRVGDLAESFGQESDASHGRSEPAGQEDGGDDPPPRGRGAVPAQGEDGEAHEGEDDAHAGGEAPEPLRQPVVRLQQREVLGETRVVEEHRRPDDDRRVDVRRDDDRPRQRALEAPGRKREQDVREEGDVQGC